MDYGWGKYRDEGVKEIKRLAGSIFFIDKPIKQEILNKYAEIYEKGEEGNLTGRHILDQRVNEDDNAFRKRVSNHIKELRKLFRGFYDSEEGKNSALEVYFVAEIRDYRLGVRPRVETKTIPEEIGKPLPPAEISFIENQLFKTKYRPFAMAILLSVLVLTVLVGVITGVIFVNNVILFAILVVFAVFALYISWNLYRLLFWKFTHFFHKYFLKRAGKKLILAAYSATCPECGGTVKLTSKKDYKKRYIAICRETEHDPTYSFKYDSLKGERREK